MSTVGFSAAGIAKVDRRGLLFASAAPFLQDGKTKLRMRVIYLDHKSAARILKIVAEALKTTNSNGSAWSQAATALLLSPSRIRSCPSESLLPQINTGTGSRRRWS